MVSSISFAKVIDKSIAVVGNEAVTNSELKEFTARLKLAPPEVTEDGKIFKDKDKMLDMLIEEKIFNHEIKRLGMEASKKEVNSEIESIRTRLNLSESELSDMLKERGTTYSTYRDFLKRQIEQRRLISQEIRSNVTVSKEDVLNYYQQNVAKTPPSIELRARHIFLITSSTDELKVRKMAEQLVLRGRSTENFAELARKYSQGPQAESGGDLGWFRPGDVIPEFQNAFKKLKPGDISDPFKTPEGIHILQLTDMRQPPPPELDDRTRDRIENILIQERISVLLNQWIQNKKRPESGYYVEKML